MKNCEGERVLQNPRSERNKSTDESLVPDLCTQNVEMMYSATTSAAGAACCTDSQ